MFAKHIYIYMHYTLSPDLAYKLVTFVNNWKTAGWKDI